MAWRVAKSLLTLQQQLNKAYPNRNKISDGTIGDVDHSKRDSDHNPWYGPGIVTAIDITHDPANGVDIDRLSDELVASKDNRIKYVIANGLILDTRTGLMPGTANKWQTYGGPNKHVSHMHISVMANSTCDDSRPWDLPMLKTGDNDMKPDERDALYDIREQLTGSRSSKPPQYAGWDTAAGKLTLVDMLRRLLERQAAVENKLDRLVAKSV